MKVAAVVVRWRGGNEVDRCLRSLLDHGGSRLARVMLVDSGSGDGGAERLAAAFSDIEVFALDENRSFAHAANAAVSAASEELILLLNPDTEVLQGAIATLIAALERRPTAAGVVPQLLNPDGTSQHRWQLRQLPTVFRLATGLSGAPTFSRPPERDSRVEQPAAAAWLVRRDVWQALDGFDEAFAPAWWEDVDFCARLLARLADREFPEREGFVVVPGARIFHHGGSSVSQLEDAAFLTAYHRNLLRYAARHRPEHLEIIARALRFSLSFKALLRPTRRQAYITTSRKIALKATTSAG